MQITSIETQPVSIAVTPDLSIVSSLGAHRISRYVVVIVRDDEGHVGYGEATVMPMWSGETQEGALAAIDNANSLTSIASHSTAMISASVEFSVRSNSTSLGFLKSNARSEVLMGVISVAFIRMTCLVPWQLIAATMAGA